MAQRLKPPGSRSEGEGADNKLAPGSLWRVRLPLGDRRTVALWGGSGLKVTSNNPSVVPNKPNGEVQELAPSGDLRVFELFGTSVGGSFIDVWGRDGAFWIRLQALVAPASPAGKAVTSAAELVWNGVRLQALPTEVITSFADGLVAGVGRQVSQDKTWALKLQATIMGDPLGFQWGYSLGVLTGLVAGLKNLLETVVDLFKLTVAALPAAAAIANPTMVLGWVASQGLLLLTSPAERELRQKQIQQARAIAEAVRFAIADIARNPDSYVDLSQQVGDRLGAMDGDWFTQDLVNRPAKELGQAIGAIVGLILFEILLELIIAMTTGGAGNAAKAGMAAAQGARGASRFA